MMGTLEDLTTWSSRRLHHVVQRDDPTLRCRQTNMADIYARTTNADIALFLCRGCPIIGECLELALREEADNTYSWGVRGGLNAKERRALIKQRKQKAEA